MLSKRKQSSLKITGLVFFSCIGLLLFPYKSGTATGYEPEEYAMKAAFIFNFTKFIEWPEKRIPNATDPYQIVVFGDGDVVKQLRTIDGKTNGERIIRVHSCDPHSYEIDSIRPRCDIVFISRHVGAADSERILQQVKGKPVLSIGEARDFTRLGGIIKFFTRDDRLHFEINVKAARENDLHVSSKLLRLAIIVEGE